LKFIGLLQTDRQLKLVTSTTGVVAQLVEALRYKPEGLGLDSQWRLWNISLK